MLNILLVHKTGAQPKIELGPEYILEHIEENDSAVERSARNHYDLVLLYKSSSLISRIKAADPRAEVMLLGCNDIEDVEALQMGASASLPEPIDMARLRNAIDGVRELVEVRRETAQLERQLSEKYIFAGGVVGRNPKMLEIFNYIRRISPYYKTVTILGETGVGKEEIAKALHTVSPASAQPFIACNCGALIEHLIESELFGHKKGSFTGAVTDKAGIFEAAGDGTVFLDEIGDLPLSFQPHLLRVLQNGDFRRVGSTQMLKAKCKVIAATNRDLAKDVKAGRFREDLYFRLTPLTINVPALRERKDDIPLLCRFILNRFHKRTGKKVLGISIPAQTALMSYDWPGNVRELENIIEHIAILTNEPFIGLDDLPSSVKEAASRESAPKENTGPRTLDEVSRAHIASVLKQCEGNRTRASEILGISRRALIRKIEKYSIAD